MAEARAPRLVRIAAGRAKLLWALLAGVAGGFVLARLGLRWEVAAILGWDGACLAFFAMVAPRLFAATPRQMRARAAQDDEGRGAILVLIVLIVAVSLVAVADELRHAQGQNGLIKSLHVALAFGTVAISWFLAHLNFALHYAHAYYDPSSIDAKGDAKGLAFPGKDAPDYWDFLHFSLIIGVACQTADIAITSKALRRVSTFHSVFAFAFNTVIVALTINLLAGLFE
jgi:uncharacterized membrane protein